MTMAPVTTTAFVVTSAPSSVMMTPAVQTAVTAGMSTQFTTVMSTSVATVTPSTTTVMTATMTSTTTPDVTATTTTVATIVSTPVTVSIAPPVTSAAATTTATVPQPQVPKLIIKLAKPTACIIAMQLTMPAMVMTTATTSDVTLQTASATDTQA